MYFDQWYCIQKLLLLNMSNGKDRVSAYNSSLLPRPAMLNIKRNKGKSARSMEGLTQT